MPLSHGAIIGGFYFLAGVVGTVASLLGGRTGVPLVPLWIIAVLWGLAEIWTVHFTKNVPALGGRGQTIVMTF